MANILRVVTTSYPKIANGAAISDVIPFHQFAGGLVVVPATWTDANIGFQVSDEELGTYVIARDNDGPIQIKSVATAATRAYEVPPTLFAAPYVKLWSKSSTDATETDTNQGAERTMKVILKG